MNYRTLEEQMDIQLNTWCKTCFYNFDGICANHCDGVVNLPEESMLDDTYGFYINQIISCNGYRKEFPFLKSQDEE